jgi:hypothetical protein
MINVESELKNLEILCATSSSTLFGDTRGMDGFNVARPLRSRL